MLHFPMANSVPVITLSAKTRAVEADVFCYRYYRKHNFRCEDNDAIAILTAHGDGDALAVDRSVFAKISHP